MSPLSPVNKLIPRTVLVDSYLLKSSAYPSVPELQLENLPPNPALKGLAAGLAAGHKAYGVPR